MASSTLKEIICSGGLFLAQDTKRFLLVRRSKGKTAGTWSIVGGKKEPTDTTAIDSLNREIKEEIGLTSTIQKIVPLELFTSNDSHFHYNTYALIVDKEFVPRLNDEHDAYAWCSLNSWPKPLHQGFKSSINNKTIKAKLELLLELI